MYLMIMDTTVIVTGATKFGNSYAKSKYLMVKIDKFLNQARAWFLKIDPVWIVGMRVCVSAPEAIND